MRKNMSSASEEGAPQLTGELHLVLDPLPLKMRPSSGEIPSISPILNMSSATVSSFLNPTWSVFPVSVLTWTSGGCWRLAKVASILRKGSEETKTWSGRSFE